MKMTPRLLLVLACAWGGLPLLQLATQPGTRVLAPVPLLLDAARVLLLLMAWGAWSRRAWIKRLAVALAIAATLVAAALFRLEREVWDVLAAAVARQPLPRGSVDDAMDIVTTGLLGQALMFAAATWAIAVVSLRVTPASAGNMASRGAVSPEPGENRLIRIGLAALLAWVLVLPPVLDVLWPLRELRHGLWTADASHARVELGDAQRQSIPPADQAVVNELNADLARIVAGDDPAYVHTSPAIVSTDTRYIGDASTYMLTVSRPNGRITSIDIWFYRKALREQLGPRTILLR